MASGSGISLPEGIGVAFTALTANKMRSALTMLGIIIGVAAMITMVALGTGAKRAVTERIEGLVSNTLEQQERDPWPAGKS